MQKTNDEYELIKFLDPDFQKQNYIEVNLSPGEYKLIPISTGISLQESRDDLSEFRITQDSLTAVIRDIFDKYSNKEGLIIVDSLRPIIAIINEGINNEQIDDILRKFGLTKHAKIGLKEFETIFNDLVKNKTEQNFQNILDDFGYSSNLLSYRSRKFNVSVHSSFSIQAKTVNSLNENLDMIVFINLIKKYGRIVEDFNEIAVRESTPIIAKYYYNQ